MCGIAGMIRWQEPERLRDDVRAMLDALAHRGPDGVGHVIVGHVALGNRRLAIVDATGGAQPMQLGGRGLSVTYNGELYNAPALRAELRDRGHQITTRSDTELLLAAYAEWDVDCVHHLRGMFAFGILDAVRQKVFLARDHLGIKPLHYRVSDQYFAFASETRALTCIGEPVSGDLNALDEFLRFQYIPPPRTIYRDIWKLPPATWLEVDLTSRHQRSTTYWNVDFTKRTLLDDDDALALVDRTVQDSMAAHLHSDVPFGILLSGGVDSTLTAAYVSRLSGLRAPAFAVGFAEQDFNETGYAQTAARKLALDLHVETMDERSLDLLPQMIVQYGEPFGDSSALAMWRLAGLARQHVSMVLSGDGGDEAFGGYDKYLRWLAAVGKPGSRVAWKQRALEIVRPVLCGSGNGRGWRHLIMQTGERDRRRLWRRGLQDLVAMPSPTVARAELQAHALDRLSYAQYLDYQTYLPAGVLTKVDVASMAHGLEVRTPLADVRVVELAATLPLSQRVRRVGDHDVGKYVLKKLLARDFPPEFVYRTKTGFSLPLRHWFMPGRRGRALLEDVLLASTGMNTLFRPKRLAHELARHSLADDNSARLWSLLTLGMWLQAHPRVSFDAARPRPMTSELTPGVA